MGYISHAFENIKGERLSHCPQDSSQIPSTTEYSRGETAEIMDN